MFPSYCVRKSYVFIASLIGFALQTACIAGGMPEQEGITGPTWKWQKTQYNNGQQSMPVEPSHYTIEFMPDGKVHVRADCNRVGGNYTTQGSRLGIELTHSTRAMCLPDSLDQVFKKDLGAASIYFLKDGFLYLDLKYDSGTIQLSR